MTNPQLWWNGIELHDEEGYESTDTETTTSEEVDKKLKRVKKVIPKESMKLMKVTKHMITLVVMMLLLSKKQKWGQVHMM